MTGDIDLFMGNYTVTDKFNARDFRVNIPFTDVSSPTFTLVKQFP